MVRGILSMNSALECRIQHRVVEDTEAEVELHLCVLRISALEWIAF
jgi:hypothetical protein